MNIEKKQEQIDEVITKKRLDQLNEVVETQKRVIGSIQTIGKKPLLVNQPLTKTPTQAAMFLPTDKEKIKLISQNELE